MQNRRSMSVGITRSDGTFELRSASSGRFVLFTAGGYSRIALQPNISRDFYGGSTDVVIRDVTLETTTLNESVTVTATGLPTPIQQLTAPVSQISRDDLATRTGIIDELRQAPGVTIVQTGQYGGVGSLFVRGGNSDSNKVLIDGIAAEDVGGRFDLGLVSTTGLSVEGNNGPAAELYRGPNSALFGSDALASVLNLSTPRGTASSPTLNYSGDGGNFHTYRNEVTLSGTHTRYDYLTAFSRLESSNALPNDRFHAITEAANLGASLTANTLARFTLRNTTSAQGVPGAHDFLVLSADQKQADQDLYSGATLENRTLGNWHNLVRYGIARKREQFYTFTPVGTYDLTQFAYIGPSVTITGANGYKATGASPISYSATPSRYDQVSNRDELYYQSDYAFNRHIAALFGFRYENERGAFRYPSFGIDQSLQRTNFQFTGQVQGDLIDRVYFSLGGAIEKNHLYGLRGTPRIGLAYVPVRPGYKVFHGTRLRANFSRGVQEPSLSVQFSSLYGTLLAANDTADIALYHVTPPKAEESRAYDVGVDQNIFSTKLVLKAGYFHNQFDHQYEYVDSDALQTYFGITTASQIPGLYGAYTNSLTFRSQGAELELQYQPRTRLFLHLGYTYLAPLVERSFSTDALQVHGATTNPLFPGITIGASSPLAGQRPFRRPPNSGFFAIQYTGKRWVPAFKGAMSGKSDDSTFLATSLLLPNRNLDHGYAKLDLSVSYLATQRLTAFTQLDNLLSQQRIGPIGYPGLPFTIRAGFKFRISRE